MAQVYTFRWCDDLDGSDAVETIEFALDRCRYSIDVSAGNAARLRAVLAPYIAAGRRTAAPVRGRVATPSTVLAPRSTLEPVVGRVPQSGSVSLPGQAPPTAAPEIEKPAVPAPAPAPAVTSTSTSAAMPAVVDRWQVKAMRQWARRHGYEVPAKGRIPDRVVAAYHQQAGTRRINIRSA